MKKSEFYFDLPDNLIAQVPLEKRDESRLLVLKQTEENFEHKLFKNILDYLNKGDCLVLNNTRVLPARLFGFKETGAKVEFLLLKRISGDRWQTMVKPGKKAKIGTTFTFGDGLLTGTIMELSEQGTRVVEFSYEGIFEEVLDKLGSMPLPPYITETLEDSERYQTVYSKHNGSAAAPTAGLHFTEELMEEIVDRGINIAYVTLHVGLGTFRPVKAEHILDHEMHSEFYILDDVNADIINKSKANGGRVVTVGTTSTRTLETIADENGIAKSGSGWTDIFIYPGYKFKIIDGLITNFHLPESTLVMLVSALAGKEKTLAAYHEAIENEYRFFSFGDAMLII